MTSVYQESGYRTACFLVPQRKARAYAWLTNAVDTNSVGARRDPGCDDDRGRRRAGGLRPDAAAFAFGYFVVRVLHVVLYAVDARGGESSGTSGPCPGAAETVPAGAGRSGVAR